jgi:CTP synthase
MTFKQVLILGDYDVSSEAQTALQESIAAAAEARGFVVNTRRLDVDELAVRPGAVAEADGVVLAPRPARAVKSTPAPILAALKLAREAKKPLLAVGDAHELVLIEVARHVLGMAGAGSTFYDEEPTDPVIKELPRPLTADDDRRTLLDVEIKDDPVLRPFLRPGRREEVVRLTHGVNPDYAYALEEGGLRPAGKDVISGRPCLWVLDQAPFYVAASFLPQLAAPVDSPHPLVVGFVAHVVGGR